MTSITGPGGRRRGAPLSRSIAGLIVRRRPLEWGGDKKSLSGVDEASHADETTALSGLRWGEGRRTRFDITLEGVIRQLPGRQFPELLLQSPRGQRLGWKRPVRSGRHLRGALIGTVSRGTTTSMARSLVIVESPAKAKTINKYLGRNYNVKASYGHVMDLPKKTIGIVLPGRRTGTGRRKQRASERERERLRVSQGPPKRTRG